MGGAKAPQNSPTVGGGRAPRSTAGKRPSNAAPRNRQRRFRVKEIMKLYNATEIMTASQTISGTKLKGQKLEGQARVPVHDALNRPKPWPRCHRIAHGLQRTPTKAQSPKKPALRPCKKIPLREHSCQNKQSASSGAVLAYAGVYCASAAYRRCTSNAARTPVYAAAHRNRGRLTQALPNKKNKCTPTNKPQP